MQFASRAHEQQLAAHGQAAPARSTKQSFSDRLIPGRKNYRADQYGGRQFLPAKNCRRASSWKELKPCLGYDRGSKEHNKQRVIVRLLIQARNAAIKCLISMTHNKLTPPVPALRTQDLLGKKRVPTSLSES